MYLHIVMVLSCTVCPLTIIVSWCVIWILENKNQISFGMARCPTKFFSFQPIFFFFFSLGWLSSTTLANETRIAVPRGSTGMNAAGLALLPPSWLESGADGQSGSCFMYVWNPTLIAFRDSEPWPCAVLQCGTVVPATDSSSGHLIKLLIAFIPNDF